MASKRISELPAAGALDGSEQIPLTQSGETRRIGSDTYGVLAQDESVTGEWKFVNVTNMGKLRVKHTPYADVTHPDWGAKGDGSTDDLQAFIDADTFFGTDPGEFWIPPTPASYLLSDMWEPSSKRLIRGGGMGGTTLQASSTLNHVLSVHQQADITLLDLALTHEATAEDTGAGIFAGNSGDTGGSQRIHIGRVLFRDLARHSVRAWDEPAYWTFVGCWVRNSIQGGFNFVNGDSIHVLGCDMEGLGDDGVAFGVNTTRCSVVGGRIKHTKADGSLIKSDATGSGVKIHGRNIAVSGVDFVQPLDSLVTVKQDNGLLSTPGNIAVSGCTLDGIVDGGNTGLTKAGVKLEDVDAYDGFLSFDGLTVDATSSTTSYRPFWVRSGTASTARVTISDCLFSGDPIGYLAGGFATFKVVDTTVDSTGRFINIGTETLNGDTILKDNTHYGPTGVNSVVQQSASAGVDYLEVGGHRVFGPDGILVSLNGAPVTTLRMGDNYAPDILPGDFVKNQGGVTNFYGRYVGRSFHDFGSVADGATATTTFGVTGARVGMLASAGIEDGLAAGAYLVAQVMSDNMVAVTLVNHSGASLDPAGASIEVTVWRDA